MTAQEILNQTSTKTKKIQMLLGLGLTRTEVARMMGIGYGFVQNVYAKLNTTIQPRTPQFNFDFSRTFGVEIETYGCDQNELIRILDEKGIQTNHGTRQQRTNQIWKITCDGSIQGNNAFEIVSPILTGEDGLNQLKIVCEALSQLRAKINKSCGLHIHFSARDFNLTTWKNLYKNYATFESKIDQFMPESRRANNNRYCKSIVSGSLSETFRNINAATTLQKLANTISGRSRYYKVNAEAYFRHETVEFRQHSGTIEFEKIKNWVLFLGRMVEFSKQGVSASQTLEAAEFLNDDIKIFYQARTTQLSR